MKTKPFLIIIIVCIAPFWQSCTKSCTCENPDGNIKEVEVDPSESCSKRSDAIWSCS
jgi:hypothetical protein